MNAPMSRHEVIMADLVATLKRIPGVMAVRDEAPREDEDAEILNPRTVPFINVWDVGGEVNTAFDANGTFEIGLAVFVELVFPYDESRGLRERGRFWAAKIQEALAADPGRGWDDTNGVRNAFDTLERSVPVVGPTTQDGFGCVHIEYAVTFQRSATDPQRAAA